MAEKGNRYIWLVEVKISGTNSKDPRVKYRPTKEKGLVLADKKYKPFEIEAYVQGRLNTAPTQEEHESGLVIAVDVKATEIKYDFSMKL